jgi:hypothetical protein
LGVGPRVKPKGLKTWSIFFFSVIPVRYHRKKGKKKGDVLKNRTPTGMVTPLFEMGPHTVEEICCVTCPRNPLEGFKQGSTCDKEFFHEKALSLRYFFRVKNTSTKTKQYLQ